MSFEVRTTSASPTGSFQVKCRTRFRMRVFLTRWPYNEEIEGEVYRIQNRQKATRKLQLNLMSARNILSVCVCWRYASIMHARLVATLKYILFCMSCLCQKCIFYLARDLFIYYFLI